MAPVRVDATTLDAVLPSLVEAFADDPVFQYLLPGGYDDRRARLAFRMLGLNMIQHGEVWSTPGREAAAFWAVPGHWKVPWSSIAKTLPLTVRAYGRNLARALFWLSKMEKVHPREPHYYLEVVGTEPASQGRGLGASLITPFLDRADAEGIGVYLESSKDSNVPYYRRFGFEVVGEISARGGPTAWPMWRAPR